MQQIKLHRYYDVKQSSFDKHDHTHIKEKQEFKMFPKHGIEFKMPLRL